MRRLRVPTAAAVFVLLVASAAACSSEDDSGGPPSVPDGAPAVEWPRYGLDLANSRFNADEALIGPDNVGDLDVLWEIDGLEGVTSTPTVVDGVVYIGDFTGHVRAIESATGDERWATEMESGTVYGSPAVADDRVFVGDQSGNVTALDRETGEVLWSEPAGEHAITIIFNSPVVVDDLVIVGTGSAENFFATDDFTFRGALVAFDAETGEQRWQTFTTADDETSGAGGAIWGTPAVDEDLGLLYVGTGQNYEPPAGPLNDSVLALDVTTGEIVWSHQYTTGDVRSFAGEETDGPDADVGAGPNLFTAGGRDLVGAGDKAGVFKALDRSTGEVVWETELTTGGVLGGVEATAAVGDGVVYVGSNIGDETTGAPLGRSLLFALDAATGETRWTAELTGSIFGSPTLANGVVYQGTQARELAAFDAGTGEQLWSRATEGDVGGGPSVVDGVVYWGYGFSIFQEAEDPKGGLLALSPA